jgi:heme/copper-type cytochrome/quinol oxidase subunit 2
VKSLRKILIAAALAGFAPSPLYACAACYGKSDSALASGMNWGIFTLLGVVLTVLTCIAVFFVHIVRKEEASTNPPPDDRPADL